MEPIFIYALLCPITGKTRYIGQTGNPDKRLRDHLATYEDYYSARWIKSLLKKNLRPVMEIIDVVPDNEADFWECEYIQNFRERGFDLTNFSDGGKTSMRGKKHSPETCAKISARKLGKKLSPEHRAKLSASRLGSKNGFFGKTHSLETREKIKAARAKQVYTPEHRTKISASLLGNGRRVGIKHSPEALTKMSLSQRGKKLSPEHRAKIAAAHKGKRKSPEHLAKINATKRARKVERGGCD